MAILQTQEHCSDFTFFSHCMDTGLAGKQNCELHIRLQGVQPLQKTLPHQITCCSCLQDSFLQVCLLLPAVPSCLQRCILLR